MTSQSSSPSRSIPPLVIRSAIVASLGGLLFGFDTAVISGAEEKLTELYALSSTGEGMLVAIATIGTIAGAIVAGNLADRFGRKPILFWIGILFGVGALATALAPLPTLVTSADGTVSASSSSISSSAFSLPTPRTLSSARLRTRRPPGGGCSVSWRCPPCSS